jgi:trk system potassium uptake protein TrkH
MLLIVSLTLFAPLAWAWSSDSSSREVYAFALTIVIGLGISFLSRSTLRFKEKEYQKLNAKDGLAIVGLSWVGLSFVGALPVYFSGVVSGFTDAFFEVVSGFTTTGATVIPNIEVLPRGILFWRSLTHWLGGAGIIVLDLALLPAFGQTSFRLFKAEFAGVTAERIHLRIKETAKIFLTVYCLLSLAEIGLLMLGRMSLFDALCHTFGTVSTGGFSTRNVSIGAYGAYVQWVVTVFMFLAGTNFVLHYYALRGDVSSYLKSEEFRAYSLLTLIAITIFIVFAFAGGAAHPVRDTAFQVVSILTTTGFRTTDFDLWPVFLKFGLILFMFIGGCSGSMGGGLKMARVVLAVKMAKSSLTQAIFPNAVLPVKMDGKPVLSQLTTGILEYFFVYIVLFFLGGLILTITDRCDLVTAFSASVASLSNVGPGLAKVGATHNYAWVSVPGKWTLIFLMLAGRLEVYSILILMLPATWRK